MTRNPRRFVALSLALSLAIAGTACSDGGDSGSASDASPSEGGSWTVLH